MKTEPEISVGCWLLYLSEHLYHNVISHRAYFSSREVSGFAGSLAFSEGSTPMDGGNSRGTEACKTLVWNWKIVSKKEINQTRTTQARSNETHRAGLSKSIHPCSQLQPYSHDCFRIQTWVQVRGHWGNTVEKGVSFGSMTVNILSKKLP